MVLEIARKVDKFLSVIQSKLEVKDELVAAQASQLAPNFNALEIFYPDENRLSTVIGVLLDPEGEHGQKDIFLKLFLEKIGVNLPTKRKTRASRGLEVSTNLLENCQRRIDILIDFGDFGLAIENKPWAVDQKNQLADYEKYLCKRYLNGHYILIYLSGDGSAPGEHSTSAAQRAQIQDRNGKIKVLSYKFLGEWVESCIEKCHSSRVRFFLDDFKSYILKKFAGGTDVFEKNLVVAEAIKAENIRSCYLVHSLWPDIAKELIQTLMELSFQSVLIHLGNSGEEWETTGFNFSLNDKYTGFGFRKKNWCKYLFKFEFDGRNAAGLAYGVCKTNNKHSNLNDLHSHLKELFGGNQSQAWPWYRNMEAPYWNWGESDVPWSGIYPNGRTVEVISEKLLLLVKEATPYIDAEEKG